MNSRFSVRMRRHLINCCLELVNSSEGLTKHHHSKLDSEAEHVMGRKVLLDCDSPMGGMKEPLSEQDIARAWRARRENAVETARKLKLFRTVYYGDSIA